MIRLRRYLVAGLLVWVPIGVTIFIFRVLLGLTERFLFWLPAAYRPDTFFGYSVPGLDAILSGVLTLIIVLVTGLLAANIAGRRLVNAYESLLARIPLIRSIYSAVKNFTEVVFGDSGASFRRVLLIEYPAEKIYSVAFQTSENAITLDDYPGEDVVTAFVPTTPNPTSGFIVFLPRSKVTEIDMPVEDALKMIVSLGVVVPKGHPMHPEHELAPRKVAP